MIGVQPTGAVARVIVSAVAHRGLEVTVDGKPARLAVITDDGEIVADGKAVAREVEAVSLNCYRNVLKAQGHLRVYGEVA